MSKKLCCRCHERPVSTPRNPYCKPCRAAYQRTWRARRKGAFAPPDTPALPAPRPVRLRSTPTAEELVRYRLI
jgi:hypothetical protein